MALTFQLRVGLLATAGLLPLFLFGAWLAEAARSEAAFHAVQQMHASANEATRSWRVGVHESRGTLLSLVGRGALAEGAEVCEDELAETLWRGSPVRRLALVEADGTVRCASPPMDVGTIDDRSGLVARALGSSVAELGLLGDAGVATPGMAVRLDPAEGAAGQVIVAWLDAEALRDEDSLANVPGPSQLVFIDMTGRVLAADPPDALPVGSSVTALGIDPAALAADRELGTVSLEGVDHLFDVTRLAGRGGVVEGYVLVTAPTAATLAPADRFRERVVFAAWGAVFSVLLVLGVTADRLLVRPLDRLVRVADRLLGTTPAADRDEFEALTTSLQRMAAAQERGGAPFRAAVDLSREGVLTVNPSGRILSANPAASRLFGLRQDQLLGASAHEVVHGPAADHDEARCPLLAGSRDGQPRERESDRFQRARGGTFPVSWVTRTVEDGLNPAAIVLVFTDRTAAAAGEERLRQAAKMEALGRLASGVAHDFNNLLTAMLGYADLLSSRLADPTLRADVEEIVGAAQRAADLSQQLLALSRPRSTRAPVEINVVTRDMERLLSRLVGERVQLLVDTDPGAGWVKADAGQIEQLLLNLVVNARDAMPEGGRVEVRTRRDGDAVFLSVSDTGTGIPDEVRPRLFEAFYTTKPGGTGLGLTTVNRIVREVHGMLEVETAPGEGTTFRARFVAAPAPSGGHVIAPGGDARGSERVVVAEDDAGVRAFVVRSLVERGYDVVEAKSGEHALALCGARPAPRLLLTDLVMPGWNGDELYRRARTRVPDLRVVYMTGYDAGPAGEPDAPLLRKPFTAAQIGAAVRAALEEPAVIGR